MKIFMMTIIVLTCFCFSTAQVIPDSLENNPEMVIFKYGENGSVEYSEVVQLPEISAENLYLRAKTWMADNFNSAKAVLDLDDKDSGLLIARGNSSVFVRMLGFNHEYKLNFSLKVECRDNRYKDTIYKLSIYIAPSQYNPGGEVDLKVSFPANEGADISKNRKKVKAAVVSSMQSTLTSLKKYMVSSNASSSDW